MSSDRDHEFRRPVPAGSHPPTDPDPFRQSLRNVLPPRSQFRRHFHTVNVPIPTISEEDPTAVARAEFARLHPSLAPNEHNNLSTDQLFQRALLESLHVIQRRLDAPPTNRSSASHSRVDVAPFRGRPSDFPRFSAAIMSKCRDESLSPHDQVSLVFSLLEGKPREYCTSFFQHGIFLDADSILAHLDAAYGDPDPDLTAVSDLLQLEQGERRFVDFAASWTTIDARVPWDRPEDLRKCFFRLAMADHLKEHLASKDPTTLSFSSVWQEAQRMDLLHQSKKTIQRPGNLRPRSDRPPPPPKFHRPPQEPPKTTNAPINTGPNPDQAKKCFSCGQMGHIAANCRNTDFKVRLAQFESLSLSDPELAEELFGATIDEMEASEELRSSPSPSPDQGNA